MDELADLDHLVVTATDKFGNPLKPWERGDVRFHTSELVYGDDVPWSWCAFCWFGGANPCECCSSEAELTWLEWLRSQDVYPLPPLSRPVLEGGATC